MKVKLTDGMYIYIYEYIYMNIYIYIYIYILYVIFVYIYILQTKISNFKQQVCKLEQWPSG